MNRKLILSVDQGTSGSKALIFNSEGKILAQSQVPLKSTFPFPGYVEQNGMEIYRSVIDAVKLVLRKFETAGGSAEEISCCGISNQRETFLLWDKEGTPVAPAVVWQCKRSAEICTELSGTLFEEKLVKRTGLRIDPYFSGTKVLHIYRNDEQIKSAIDKGLILFGTVDTWLLFCLTEGKEYRTDHTNASRTMFMNLDTLEWDTDILSDLGLTGLILPEISTSAGNFGISTFEGLFPEPIPVTGMIGDSHAAAFGEKCYRPGTAKVTLGTGSSILLNTGERVSESTKGMVTTVCWSVPDRIDYAMEGIIVSCGSTITWMKDQAKFFNTNADSDIMAESVESNAGVYLIPAFSGLGAPWWKMNQKGLITGLTFASTAAHIVRAGLESIAYQVADVIKAMETESKKNLIELNADGGITVSKFVMQYIADIIGKPVRIKEMKEASALGAALMAGLGSGIFKSVENLEKINYDGLTYYPDRTTEALKSYREWYSILEGLD